MMKFFLYQILLFMIVLSCNDRKKNGEVIKSNDINELKKYINIDVNVKKCLFEISKRGNKKQRSDIGLNDYELFAVLNYQKEDFIDIVKKIHNYNKLNNVYLDINKLPEWIPSDLITEFNKEGEYYHLVNSYESKLFLLHNQNSLFREGFCYISNDNSIFLYFYTN